MEFASFDHAEWLADAWADGKPKHDLGRSGFVPEDPLMGLPTDIRAEDVAHMDLTAATELRAALARRFGRDDDEVRVTSGTSGANTAAIAALVSPGDHVVCERPIYTPLRHLAQAFGATITDVPHGRDGLDAGAVADAITDRTAVVLLASPNNPTGASPGAVAWQVIGDAAADHDAWVVADQVYRELSDESLGADVHPRLITTAGFNKCWGAPGLRIGWMVGDPIVMHRAHDAQMAMSLTHPPLGARLGIALLEQEPARRAALEQRVAENHTIYEDWCGRHRLPADHGRLIAFLRVGHADTLSWARALIRHGINVVPGELFGQPGGIRIGLTGPPAEFAAALSALGEHL